jgi:Arc/MetJ family transcription regulator
MPRCASNVRLQMTALDALKTMLRRNTVHNLLDNALCDRAIHKNMIILHIEGAWIMRTNIDIDERLMRQAMKSSRSRTKRAAVEAGLRLLVQTRAQANIRRLRGKIRWEGDLDKSRLGQQSD